MGDTRHEAHANDGNRLSVKRFQPGGLGNHFNAGPSDGRDDGIARHGGGLRLGGSFRSRLRGGFLPFCFGRRRLFGLLRSGLLVFDAACLVTDDPVPLGRGQDAQPKGDERQKGSFHVIRVCL